MWYSAGVPACCWDEEKDELLKRTRGISFADVVRQLEHGGPLATIDHPNPVRHPNQRIYIVRIRDYVYRVPFQITVRGVFLRTVFPSSVDTRDYLP